MGKKNKCERKTSTTEMHIAAHRSRSSRRSAISHFAGDIYYIWSEQNRSMREISITTKNQTHSRILYSTTLYVFTLAIDRLWSSDAFLPWQSFHTAFLCIFIHSHWLDELSMCEEFLRVHELANFSANI